MYAQNSSWPLPKDLTFVQKLPCTVVTSYNMETLCLGYRKGEMKNNFTSNEISTAPPGQPLQMNFILPCVFFFFLIPSSLATPSYPWNMHLANPALSCCWHVTTLWVLQCHHPYLHHWEPAVSFWVLQLAPWWCAVLHALDGTLRSPGLPDFSIAKGCGYPGSVEREPKQRKKKKRYLKVEL